MKKKVAICLSLLLVLGTLISDVFVGTSVWAANIEQTESKIRVLIGNTEILSDKNAKTYIALQTNYLKKQAISNPEKIASALISFDSFRSPDELSETMQVVERIDTVYIWMPGKDGRSIIKVKDNDVDKTISAFLRSVELDETDSEYNADMIDLINHYGIFALEVHATNKALKELTNTVHVAQVDLIYNEEAELLSARTNKPVSYICIPEKPDGTH